MYVVVHYFVYMGLNTKVFKRLQIGDLKQRAEMTKFLF